MTATIGPSDIEQLDVFQKVASPMTSVLKILEADKISPFIVFKLKQGHTIFTTYYCIVLTIVNLWTWFAFVHNTKVPELLRTTVCIKATVMPVFVWLYFYRSKHYVHSDTLNIKGKRMMMLGSGLLVTQALLVSALLLFQELTHDDCESDLCEEDLLDRNLPMKGFLYAVSGSISIPIFFPYHHAIANLFAIVTIYSTMFAVAIMRNVHGTDLLGVAVLGVLIFFTFVILNGSLFLNYSSYSKFETALRLKLASENKEYLTKIQTEEMRHMIGVTFYIVELQLPSHNLLYCI